MKTSSSAWASPSPEPAFDLDAAEAAAEDGVALVIDLDGYEGPLHILLALARKQKVDLRRLSVAMLADQYLAFIQGARRRRFSLAADYLVMAAWLTFLKSRLMLPKLERTGPGEQAVEDIAEILTRRLARLDGVRRAVDALQARPQLGRDVFARIDHGVAPVVSARPVAGDLHELIAAYAGLRRRAVARRYRPGVRVEAYPLEAARAELRQHLPELATWTRLSALAPSPEPSEPGPSRASYLASTLSAGLEMVREGALEASQAGTFADLYLRRREASPALLAAE